MRYAATCVLEPDRYPLFVKTRRYRKVPPILINHRPFAVFSQVQEDLKQALPVRPDQRQRRIHFNGKVDVLFLQRWFTTMRNSSSREARSTLEA